MLLQTAMLAGMMAVVGDDPPPVRQDRPIAAWFAPEIDFDQQGILPLGLQVGWQVYGPFCLFAGGAWARGKRGTEAGRFRGALVPDGRPGRALPVHGRRQ